MAQKKKKAKNIKKHQQYVKKTASKKISVKQIVIMVFSAVIILSFVFGTLAQSF